MAATPIYAKPPKGPRPRSADSAGAAGDGAGAEVGEDALGQRERAEALGAADRGGRPPRDRGEEGADLGLQGLGLLDREHLGREEVAEVVRGERREVAAPAGGALEFGARQRRGLPHEQRLT